LIFDAAKIYENTFDHSNETLSEIVAIAFFKLAHLIDKLLQKFFILTIYEIVQNARSGLC